MNYLIFKSLHIISVVAWFAALFYMPRLFVYFAEAGLKPEPEKSILQAQFKIMQRRLWYGIATPASIIVAIFGLSMIHNYLPLTNHPWLMVKLVFVFGLYAYHSFLEKILKQQQKDIISYSPMALRVINEIAIIFLFAIVFLVVMKSVINMVYGIVALFALIIILMIAIKVYKNIREKSEKEAGRNHE